MKKNASRLDAVVRRLFGILSAGIGIILVAVASYILGAVFLALGLYLILSATFRFYPEYALFHKRTRHGPMGPDDAR